MFNSLKVPACAVVFTFLLFSISVLVGQAQDAAKPDSSAQDASKQDTHGIAVANMGRSGKPGDDFYDYANGEWIKRTVIPPDRAGVGVFTTLCDLRNKRTAALIEE